MSAPLPIGEVLDSRFRVEAHLGHGGMGAVYRATDLTDGRAVAVKVLHPDLLGYEWIRRRFEREARALSKLSHPRIVPVVGYGVANDVPYLVMDLLDGRSLTQLLHEDGALEPARAVAIADGVLEGVGWAHAQGAAHRDLNTSNVYVGPDDVPRLLDFGLVKFMDSRWGAQTTLTAEGEVFGTPAYMAPEQAAGEKAGPRADVYALGVVLFEMLAGRRPFPYAAKHELLRAHLGEPVPHLWDVRPDLRDHRALDSIVQRAMAKSARDRFPDANAMRAAVADAAIADAERTVPDRGSEGESRSSGTRVVLLFVGGIVLVVVGGACAIAAGVLGLLAL